MPRRYTVEVEVHRTVSVTPNRSVGWGSLVLLFIVLYAALAALLYALPDRKSTTAQHLENDYGTAPDDFDPNVAPDTAHEPETIKTELQKPAVKSAAGHVVAEARIDGDGKCVVPGFLTAENTAALKFEIDTGAGEAIWVSATHLPALGINPKKLQFQELDPGTRYGKVANARLRAVRIGGVTVRDVDAQILTRWRYTFGNGENPLIGIPFLKKSGLHIEVNGDACKLIGPPTTIAGLLDRLIETTR
jgi:predicted aspartyl protease